MELVKKINSWQKCFLIIIFLLPLYLIKIKFGFFSFNLWEISIIFLFLSSFFLFDSFFQRARDFWIKFRWMIFAWGVILAGLFLSSLLNANIYQNLGIIKGWFIFPFVFTFLFHIFFPKKEMKLVLETFYIVAAIVATISLVYFFFGKTTYDGRLEAFFNSPNYLAMFLSPAIILAAGFLGRKEPNIFLGKKLLLFSLPILLVALALTSSYASWGALFVVLGLFFLFKRERRKTFLIFFVSIAILLVVSVSFSGNLSKIEDLISLDERSSLASRTMIWKSAWEIGKDNCLLGIGPANFQEKYLDYQKYFPPYLEWAVPHPHNIFLSFWLSGGLLALAGFLFSLTILVFPGQNLKKLKGYQLAGLGVVLYFLLHGLLDTTYFKNDLAVIFWLNYFFAYRNIQ